MKLEWSAWAQVDRGAIFDYIEADNPRAAIAVDERIEKLTQTLARFPGSGRPGRIEGTRELVDQWGQTRLIRGSPACEVEALDGLSSIKVPKPG